MCDIQSNETGNRIGIQTIPITEAVGMVLAHDITEIRKDEFKGRAFKKGHIVREEDINHLQRLGKEHLFVLNIAEDEVHEDAVAYALANALMGEGVKMEGEPKEGKINIIADRDGLFKVNKDALLRFNMLGDVMCATLHDNTVVKKGQVVAGTRAIPLVVKKSIVEQAVAIATQARSVESEVTPSLTLPPRGGGQGWGGILEVKEMRRPKAGIVITGNEVYYGRIKDAFAPILTRKVREFDGEIVGIYYAPDDENFIQERLRELIDAGADLLITTGGMSVDPDDVTRFAIKMLGATDITYGSAVLPGAMFLVAYLATRDERQETNSETRDKGQETSKYNNSSLVTCHSSLEKSLVTRHSSLEKSLVTRHSSLIPILGIPACGMYHRTTVFDLILPRVLAGERIGRKELAEFGHGGLCRDCKKCRYPVCPFGK